MCLQYAAYQEEMFRYKQSFRFVLVYFGCIHKVLFWAEEEVWVTERLWVKKGTLLDLCFSAVPLPPLLHVHWENTIHLR